MSTSTSSQHPGNGAAIAAQNAQHVAQHAQAATAPLNDIPEPNYTSREVKYFFKKDKDLGERRPTVTLQVPAITWSGLVAALHDEKQRDYVLDLVNLELAAAVRVQVNDDTRPVNKQEELDVNRVSLHYLANEPKAERAGHGIQKETWEEFSEDYTGIMPGLTGKSPEHVANAVKLFVGRLQACKTKKPVLHVLNKYLDLWFQSTTNAEQFSKVYEFLHDKIDVFLNATDEDLLASL